MKDIYLKGRVFKVGDGKIVDFWKDRWCGAVTLEEKFPELFEICNNQFGSVSDFAARR